MSRTPYLINSEQVLHKTASIEDMRDVAQYNRYRYYTKLHGSSNEPLVRLSNIIYLYLLYMFHFNRQYCF